MALMHLVSYPLFMSDTTYTHAYTPYTAYPIYLSTRTQLILIASYTPYAPLCLQCMCFTCCVDGGHKGESESIRGIKRYKGYKEAHK